MSLHLIIIMQDSINDLKDISKEIGIAGFVIYELLFMIIVDLRMRTE